MRPVFRRSEFGRFKKLKEKWRKPRGIHNKIREGKKGIKPKIGWKKPEKEEIPRIENLNELKNLKAKEIIISSAVGKKKRLEIEKYCKESNIKILNIKKSDKKKPEIKSDKKEKSEKIKDEKKTE